MPACFGLQQAGNEAPQRAARGTCQQGEGHVDVGRQAGDRVADVGGSRGTHEQLPFHADIEKARSKAHCHSQASKNVRGGLHEAFKRWVEGRADFLGVPQFQRVNDADRVSERAGEERLVGCADFP